MKGMWSESEKLKRAAPWSQWRKSMRTMTVHKAGGRFFSSHFPCWNVSKPWHGLHSAMPDNRGKNFPAASKFAQKPFQQGIFWRQPQPGHVHCLSFFLDVLESDPVDKAQAWRCKVIRYSLRPVIASSLDFQNDPQEISSESDWPSHFVFSGGGGGGSGVVGGVS